jgi:dTDP-4-dehydrorhamnose reductase
MAPQVSAPVALPVARPQVLVIGSRGMLARDLLAGLAHRGFTTLGYDLPEVDITQPAELFAKLQTIAPELVMNCAAYTAVDQAEREEEPAFAVNREGPAHLADACRRLGIPLLHISTDYVFDGSATRPYREDDPVNPLGVYGRSKWEGEQAVRARLGQHLIVRTAWLYGVHGNNFVKTILRLAREREQLRVVADQYGSPTWTVDLAGALVTMTERVLADRAAVSWGTYHFCGAGHTNWHGLATAIVEAAQRGETLKVREVLPITTDEYPLPAARPAWSVLDCSKITSNFGVAPRFWQLGLEEMLQRLAVLGA